MPLTAMSPPAGERGGLRKSGTYFLLDLGRVERVGKISYIPAGYREVPGGYQVALSLDGKNWQKVADVPDYRGPTFWSGPKPMTKIRHGRVETVFPPRLCRFVKISLLSSNSNPWSITELFLFSPDERPGKIRTLIPNEEEIDRLLAFLQAQKITFVYTDQWLSAIIRVKSQGKIGALISNLFLGDNGENEPSADNYIGVNLKKKVALIVQTRDNGLFGKGFAGI